MKLLVDGVIGHAMYGGWTLAFAVIAAWTVAATVPAAFCQR